MSSDELQAWLRLMLTPGVGNRSARKLLAAFGLPTQIFAASPAALAQTVSAGMAQSLRTVPATWADAWQATQSWLAASHSDGLPRHVLTLGDPGYPDSLLNTEDPPCMLFALGDVAALRADSQQRLAMVGSRNPTPQGVQTARAFARHFADMGVCIVSGLAHGIDAAAHEGALSSSLRWPTIAVVGTGLDRVYPKQNQALARQIAQRGLLISEYAPGTPPLPANFPKRNRIISGLTRGTLVVEAALQSGSLITARLAGEQGKDVFAVPGSIHGTQSRGCHALIRDGARLVESAQDILDEWQWQASRAASGIAPDALASDKEDSHDAHDAHDSGEHAELLRALGADPVSLDALQARTGLPTDRLQAQLLDLELDGQVGRLPGQLFQRIATL